MRLSDRTFSSLIGFGSERDLPDLGSRLGLVSFDDRAHAVWTDTRGGTPASNKQDLAHAVVRPSQGSGWRTPLLVAGGLAAATGAMVLIWAIVAQRRPVQGADRASL